MPNLSKPGRARLAAYLQDHVLPDDRRAHALLLRHVFGPRGYAAPGALLHRAFEDHEIFFDPRDEKIGATLLGGREWQRWAVRRAVGLLKAAGRDPAGKLLIDAGANIGTTLIYAMRDGGFRAAYAFEPDHENREILTRNISVNGLGDRVRIEHCAVGSSDGRAMLQRDPQNFGRHRLRPQDDEADDAPLVRVLAMGQYLADNDLDPDEIGLVKIDVEGFELEVLDGMADLRAAKVPILIEVTGFADDPERLERFKRQVAGYSCLADLDAELPEVIDPAGFTPDGPQQDLLIY